MNYLGLDIGATRLRAAVFDDDLNMLFCRKLDNDPGLSGAENLDRLLSAVGQFEFAGVGIGSPGPVDIPTGTILNPPNMTLWDNFPVAKYVRERVGAPARLNNDANLAGLAEALLGAGKGLESIFYITVSTGIGGAFVWQGRLLDGANSASGEIFNLIVNEDEYCHRGVSPGAVNEQCGGHALERIARAAYKRDVSVPELFSLYVQGDEKARGILDRCADNMGKLINNIGCVVDPHAYVLGGAIALNNPWYVDMVRQKAARFVVHPQTLDIRLARLGDDAGLYGAGMLAQKL